LIGLIQRVRSAEVRVGDEVTGAIGPGLLLLLGIQKRDDRAAAERLLRRVLAYRVFTDRNGQMNLSLTDVRGELLVVSQFTLVADTRKGLRPSFSAAAPPEQARDLYDHFLQMGRSLHGQVASGMFAADMQVHLINDGPVTFQLEV
jgi:D-tyrosyl-tRNA(Tyr) deacylase